MGLALALVATGALARPPVANPWDGEYSELTDWQMRRGTIDAGIVLSGGPTGLQAAADHVMSYQCADGGWGWPHEPCPTTTYNNITGPISLGLLHAYEYTHDPAILQAAVDAGDFDLTFVYTNGESRFGAFTPYFLWQLQNTLGVASSPPYSPYADHVTYEFFEELYNGTYGPDDLDTAGWILSVETARTGTWVNLRPWEFHNIVPTAEALGYPGQMDLFIQGVLDGLNTLDNTDPDNVYNDLIGLAGGVRGLAFAELMTFPAINSPNHSGIDLIDNLCDLADQLAAYQNANGSWYWHSNLTAPGSSDEDTQTTAYAVLALAQAEQAGCGPYTTEIELAQAWLKTMQDPADGAFLSYPGGDKNTEVIGEGLNASSAEALLLLEADSCQADADGAAGHQIEVEVWVRDLTGLATGYQGFLTYDTAALTYRPLLSSYDSTVFDNHFTAIAVAETVDGQPGTLWLDGNDTSNTGTAADTLLATLVFDVNSDCELTDVEFDLNSLYGFLSEVSYLGVPLDTGVLDADGLLFDLATPTMTAPAAVTLSADASTCAQGTPDWFERFYAAPCVAANQTPDCWYVDRYAPNGFTNEYFDGDYRLKHSVSSADSYGNRPSGYQSTFYNYQGRKYDVNTPVPGTISADLYIPSSWATDARHASLWATTYAGSSYLSGYPIMGFTANDPTDPTNPNPAPGDIVTTFRVWKDSYPGPGWVDLGLPTGFVYDAWYTLEVEFTTYSYTYRIKDAGGTMLLSYSYVRSDPVAWIGNIMLQGYNFSDATYPVGDSYDIYWDNVKLGPEGPVADDGCSWIESITYERSDNPLLTLDDPFPAGVTTVTWTAADACGNFVTDTQTITVDAVNDVLVEVQLNGNVSPVTRCVHFVFDDCGTTADAEVYFFDHDNDTFGPMRGVAQIQVPCGTSWSMLCAKDEQHTKWDTTALSVVGTNYQGDSILALEGSDTDNDGDCDINDVTWYLAQAGAPANPGGCPWDGVTRDADFNNNGVVDSVADYSFLADNWLTTSSCACSVFLSQPPLIVQKQQVERSTAGLPAEVARRADLNRDGKINFEDVMLFEVEHGLPATLSTKMWISTEEAILQN